MENENQLDEYAPWLAIIIALVGAGLRVFLLDSKGMWLDETFSIWLARHNVGEMLQWIARIDQHPPLYYLLLHFWIGLKGDSPYYTRLLSVMFGVATIPVIFLIGRRLSGAAVGLAAALLLAISPFNIRFAQDARMYTLLAFNASVAIYALARLLTDPCSASRPIGSQFQEYLRAWRMAKPAETRAEDDFSYRDEGRSQTGWRGWIARHRWLPFQAIATDLSWGLLIVFTAAMLLTHNTAVLFLAAINIFVLSLIFFQRRKKSLSPPSLQAPSLGNWMKAQLGIFVLWSPWFFTFLRQGSRVYEEFWIPAPDWDTVTQTLGAFLNITAPGRTSPVITFMWILYWVVLGLGLVYFRRNFPRFLFLAALFTIPILIELVVSIRRPIFLGRTLVWVTIPLLLLLAAGIAQFRFRFLVILIAAIFFTNNISSAGDYYRFGQNEDWSNPAGYVANYAQKNDLVLFNASWVQIPFDYYFKAYEDLYLIQVEKRGLPADLFDRGILEPKMTENDIPRLHSLLDGRKRVWLVYSHDWYTDPEGIIPRAIASEMKLVQEREFYGVKVQLYGAP